MTVGEELIQNRKEKLEELQKKNVNPYPYSFALTHRSGEILHNPQYQQLESNSHTQDRVRVAGRIVLKRPMGKAGFAHIQDGEGRIQFYARLDQIGEENFALYKNLDLGDIVGVEGDVFKTKTGEISIAAKKIELLAKSLKPLPEKWHGLTDKELRYRERYLDLIVNADVREVFRTRSKVIRSVRTFLEKEEYLEVDTPVLHTLAGGAAATPFVTHHEALDMKLYLRIALELHLKRLLVGGFEKVFEIGRVFRNEGISFKHNPEYTLLELYQAYVDYEGMMDITERLVSSVLKETAGSTKITYGDHTLDFGAPWKRITMTDALKEYGGIDIGAPEGDLRKAALAKGVEGAKEISIGKLMNVLYDKYVEKHLIQPTFVLDYPIETTPLAKKKRGNPRLVERFEVIVAGMELANAFSELNDPLDQRGRLEEQLLLKKAGETDTESLDEDFLNALEIGMPPAGGLGIGIDRLVMLAANQPSIRDVIFFPHMRVEQK